jgi:hypothetical protein
MKLSSAIESFLAKIGSFTSIGEETGVIKVLLGRQNLAIS